MPRLRLTPLAAKPIFSVPLTIAPSVTPTSKLLLSSVTTVATNLAVDDDLGRAGRWQARAEHGDGLVGLYRCAADEGDGGRF